MGHACRGHCETDVGLFGVQLANVFEKEQKGWPCVLVVS